MLSRKLLRHKKVFTIWNVKKKNRKQNTCKNQKIFVLSRTKTYLIITVKHFLQVQILQVFLH